MLPARAEGSADAGGIIFSKDRPLQLDALIRSYVLHVAPQAPLTVVFDASTGAYQQAYEEVAHLHESPVIQFILEKEQGGFRKALVALVVTASTDTLFFLVDDIVFTEDVQLRRLAELALEGHVPSMRLGRNLTSSYTMQRRQPLPPMKRMIISSDQGSSVSPSTSDLWAWRWRSGELDWAYPLSVDGNVFATDEIRRCILQAEFTAPNSLEDALQSHVGVFLPRWGICYEKSRLVNIPMNRVQNAIPNQHGSIHQDDLLALWARGQRLDVRALSGFRNSSAHEEVPVAFIERSL